MYMVILNFKLLQLDTEYPIFSFMTWYILKEIDTLLWYDVTSPLFSIFLA